MDKRPTALVTGGARGIGYASAEALAESGARIVIADINESGAREAAGKLGGDTIAYRCDIGQPEEVLRLFDDIEGDVGPVSILVNNAGVALPGDHSRTVDVFAAR